MLYTRYHDPIRAEHKCQPKIIISYRVNKSKLRQRLMTMSLCYEEMLKLTEKLLRLKYILWGCILKSVRFIVYKEIKNENIFKVFLIKLDQSYLQGYIRI